MVVIAWGITGAGHLLKETIEVLEILRSKEVEVTVYVSRAGYEVLKFYGLLNKLKSIISGSFPNEIIFEHEEGFSFPKSARVYTGIYDFVVISPTTFNTLAKIVHGISDTLITNLVSHALKVGIPVYLIPSDKPYIQKSKIPIYIDKKHCNCIECKVVNICPKNAIYFDGKKAHIDIKKCDLCMKCIEYCPNKAIIKDYEIIIQPHPLLNELLDKAKSIGIKILETPYEVLKIINL